jgi:hypothetical protein
LHAAGAHVLVSARDLGTLTEWAASCKSQGLPVELLSLDVTDALQVKYVARQVAAGGQLDFLDAELSYLVDYQMVPVHEPTWSASYRPTDKWAEPSVEQAAACMRQVFEGQAEARARATQLSKRVLREFSSEAIVTSLIEALADRGGN